MGIEKNISEMILLIFLNFQVIGCELLGKLNIHRKVYGNSLETDFSIRFT